MGEQLAPRFFRSQIYTGKTKVYPPEISLVSALDVGLIILSYKRRRGSHWLLANTIKCINDNTECSRIISYYNVITPVDCYWYYNHSQHTAKYRQINYRIGGQWYQLVFVTVLGQSAVPHYRLYDSVAQPFSIHLPVEFSSKLLLPYTLPKCLHRVDRRFFFACPPSDSPEHPLGWGTCWFIEFASGLGRGISITVRQNNRTV